MDNMVTVADAEQMIMSQVKDFGNELVPIEHAVGRVLAADLKADRDLPPCNRVTMDGIAIDYSAFEKGVRSFPIKATIAAGDMPANIAAGQCVEIMTGAALPDSADTVIRYEDISIKDSIATIHTETIRKGQNIHRKGKDKKQHDIVAFANQLIDPALLSMAASVGSDVLSVKKLPRVVIISTGDELVGITEQPSDYQVRSSNTPTIKAVLQRYCITADTLHLPDEPKITKEKLRECLAQYDVVLLSGGVSMGKFDYVPEVLGALKVTKIFHKVQQRPGKPFWFGRHEDGTLVFAFPGNPVSTFLCLHRYFLPWLEACMQIPNSRSQISGFKYAILNTDLVFIPPLQYFVQVQLQLNEKGHLLATPIEGNGSGDFANLLDSNAFMELPLEQSNFKQGEVYPIWPFKRII